MEPEKEPEVPTGQKLRRHGDVVEAQLREALNRLSAEHRDVLVMKDIEGMKYEEIGRASCRERVCELV